MSFDEARGALVGEARELLANMEQALLEIESGGYNDELINAIFRAAHTIKGSAGLFGLDSLVAFTHAVETLLDQVRNGAFTIDGEMLSLLLTCGDYIGSLISAVEDGTDALEPNAELRQHLLRQLQEYLETPADSAALAATAAAPIPSIEIAAPAEQPDEVSPATAATVSSDLWHLSLHLSADVLRSGMDPLSFIRYLGTLGQIVNIYTLTDGLPEANDFNAETHYLAYEIVFDSTATRQEIEAVFEFLQDDSDITILPPHSQIQAYVQLIETLAQPPKLLGEILVRCGALTPRELEQVLAQQQAAQQPVTPLGKILVEQNKVAQPVVDAALSKQKHADERRVHEQVFVKIEVGKLDHLINLVGELVIAGAAANLALRDENLATLNEANANMTVLVEHIRDASLALRMVAIGEAFQRFPRVVRDISKELNKEIELVVTGAETELDKSMVDKLTDPLTHIVRNSLDHGIETASERAAAGKSSNGTLRLNAYHDSGSIVLEVSDDGRGLNREKIVAKALEKGLIQADQTLTDKEVYRLIFEAGFSTAEQVTNLSGRGVGMDVVRRNIEQLRGDVEVDSQMGQGTTVRIRLPLTLAIIDGFQVKVADEVFVLPLDQVVECIDLDQQESHHELFNLRDEPLPYIRLRKFFGLPSAPAEVRESLVVLQFAQNRAGVVVDELIGESQAVIKPLSSIFRHASGLSGSTILGNGRVALILDVPHLMQKITQPTTDQARTTTGGSALRD